MVHVLNVFHFLCLPQIKISEGATYAIDWFDLV